MIYEVQLIKKIETSTFLLINQYSIEYFKLLFEIAIIYLL